MVSGCYCGSGYWCPAHPHIPPFNLKGTTTGSSTHSLGIQASTSLYSSNLDAHQDYNSTAQHYRHPVLHNGLIGSSGPFVQAPSSASQTTLKRPSTVAPAPSGRKRVRTQKDTSSAAQPESSTSSRIATVHQLEAAQRAAASVPQLYHIDDEVDSARHIQVARAIDCWYFYVGAQKREQPSTQEMENLRLADRARVEGQMPLDLRKPSSPFLRCTECLKNNKWRTWKNNNGGGSASRLRPHLFKEHHSVYVAACEKIGYKIDVERDPNADSDDVHEPITAEGILRHLTEWFAEDDISFNVVSHRGFRRFFSYIGQGKVTTKDIPDRHAISLKAQKLSAEAKERLKKEIKHARGRISCTSDLWTDETQRAFMSITAHFVNKHRRMVHRLIGFRVIEGDHSGAHLAETFFEVVEEFGFTKKLGMITLDNASNNDTFMAQLETYMTERGLDFDRNGNRLRCFPHVINLAVQAILSALPESAKLFRHYQEKSGQAIDIGLETYLLALESEPHNRIRKTAVALRRTQRRQGLRKTIREGNEQHIWRTHRLIDNEWRLEEFEMKLLELILDCPTRWSSTRNMIERFLYLYPAVSRYIASDPTLAEYAITHTDYEVLSDILDVLDLAHRTQELLSSDRTPTLSLALPLYHALIDHWRDLQAKRPVLSHAISAGIDKLEAYLAKTRSSPAHIVAMALNPSIRYEWIDQNWSPADTLNAREVVKQHMRRCLDEEQQERSELVPRATQPIEVDSATKRLNKGYASFLTTGVSARPNSALFAPSSLSTSLETSEDSRSPSQATSNLGLHANNHVSLPTSTLNDAIVELEHQCFLEEPVIPAKDMENISPIDYWLSKSSRLPLICKLALDLLPSQALSVSSECVFSSSKLTCTQFRNRISASNVEALQILKHSLRSNPDSPLDDEVHTLDLMAQHDDEFTGPGIISTVD